MIKTRCLNKMAWHRLIFQQILMFGWPPGKGGHFCSLPKSPPAAAGASMPSRAARLAPVNSLALSRLHNGPHSIPKPAVSRHGTGPLTPQYRPSCKPMRRIPKHKDAAGGFGSIDSDAVHDLPGHGPPATARPCLCIRQWQQQRPENHHESRRQAMSTSPPKPFAAQNLPKSEKISNFEANLR